MYCKRSQSQLWCTHTHTHATEEIGERTPCVTKFYFWFRIGTCYAWVRTGPHGRNAAAAIQIEKIAKIYFGCLYLDGSGCGKMPNADKRRTRRMQTIFCLVARNIQTLIFLRQLIHFIVFHLFSDLHDWMDNWN